MVVLDPQGKERARIEGYLPTYEFTAQLENALGRVAFTNKNYPEAIRWYGDVIQRFPQSAAAPEAVYWRGVSEYRNTNDHTVLSKITDDLQKNYPNSIWAAKAIPWAH